ncbi:MAG: hypothetical protein EAZ91_01455 [Cytophagales bacterium]|nr:MAG: hypothetical protein EAZ91_01455 [Cytophagales bacterium]
MQEKEPIEPYEYQFKGGINNSYFFSTDGGVKYEIKFVPSTEYFDGYEALDVDVFEMVIAVADNPGGVDCPLTSRRPPLFLPFLSTSSPQTAMHSFSSATRRMGANRHGFASLLRGFMMKIHWRCPPNLT